MKDKKTITKFDVNGEQVQLIETVTNNRNAYLKVKAASEIHFQKPKWMSDKHAQKFLEENLGKLIKAAIKVKENKPYSLEEQWVYLYGKMYNIDFKSGRGYKVYDSYIEMKGSNDERAFANFIANESETILKMAEDMAIRFGFKANFTMKNMRTQWGVCYPATRQINLSTRLLHQSLDAINYVIIHELAHLIVPNHSEKFWQTVEKMFPSYKEVKKELKRW